MVMLLDFKFAFQACCGLIRRENVNHSRSIKHHWNKSTSLHYILSRQNYEGQRVCLRNTHHACKQSNNVLSLLNALISKTFFFLPTFTLKVPFQDALDLVRTRKVYLKAGYVYIPHQDIVTIVLNDFRMRLSKALAVSIYKQINNVILFCI